MRTHYQAEKTGCMDTAAIESRISEPGRMRAFAMRASILTAFGVLSGTLTGCGEDEAYNQISGETLERISAIESTPARAILYSNVDFKVTDHVIPQPCSDGTCTYSYHYGRVESAVVYPGCQITFYDGGSRKKSYIANNSSPYYVSSLAHKDERERWNRVETKCEGHGPVLSHDAMAWSEAGQSGEMLPLFVGQKWEYPNWFRNKVSSFEVVSGHYVVAYVGEDTRMATTIIDSTNLNTSLINLDNKITKTEVHKYDGGVVGCSTPRGCYEGATCNTEPHTVDAKFPGLDTCHAVHGFTSYCTAQRKCVDAETGEPKVVSNEDEEK